MSNRITNNYKQGNGDLGYSLLLDGHTISKDDPSCWIYSEIEHLNNLISEVICNYNIEYEELLTVLKWLQKNSFSISSFCFMKGNTTNHSLSIDFADEVEWLVKQLKGDKVIGEAIDFVINTNIKYIKLDAIRIRVRDVERAFTKWRRHDLITNYVIDTVREDPDKAQSIVRKIDNYAGFLNRLSTFIWLASRKEAELCSDFQQQEYWTGKIT